MKKQVLKLLRNNQKHMTQQQFKALHRQASSGDAEGVLRGLQNIFKA